MSRFTQLISGLRTRKSLLILAALLLVINILRATTTHFNQKQEEVSAQTARLEQYRIDTRKLVEMRGRVAWLNKQKKVLDSYLFAGKSEEKIVSDMQIMLQEQITKAGLAVESLRPIRRIDKAKDKDIDYGEVTIKIRLSGTLNQFVDFLAQLYKSKSLYQVEGLTLKPYKNSLKIFIDIKGYYKITV
jgi:hypothetical protein